VSEISMIRGDTASFSGTVMRAGAPVNLTGAKLWFTAKRSRSDLDEAAVIKKDTVLGGVVILSPTSGTYRVTILPADTSSLTYTIQLFYDVQLLEPDGTVTTIESGTLEVDASRDITRAQS
jgi:hypothetical protein